MSCSTCRFWLRWRKTDVGVCRWPMADVVRSLLSSDGRQGAPQLTIGVTCGSYAKCEHHLPVPTAAIRFVFPMHNRLSATMNLLADVERETEDCEYDVRVAVYDDGSDEDVSEVQKRIMENGWEYHRSAVPHGKKGYWELVSNMFGDCRELPSDSFFVMVANDYRLCRRFFVRALGAWQAISDQKKAALNLLADRQRDNVAQWTGFPPVKHNAHIWKTQWNDGVLLCPISTLAFLEFRIDQPPKHRWERRGISSGVWHNFSSRLHQAGYGLYRVHRSLTVHAHWPSTMHDPGKRRAEPIVAHRYVDGNGACALLAAPDMICASLASIPSREEQLKRVVGSLLPQVHKLRVYLNGYKDVPTWLRDTRITVQQSEEHGDMGDAGKFFWCEQAAGYQLVCDDDLIYPDDYALICVEAVERYARRAVIGFHGINIKQPVTSYFKSRRIIHWSTALDHDEPVHMLGTGALAYHSSTVSVQRTAFELPNMADVWFGVLCQQQRTPMMCVARRAQLLQLLRCPWTLFQRFHDHDEQQTAAVRRVNWELHHV